MKFNEYYIQKKIGIVSSFFVLRPTLMSQISSCHALGVELRECLPA